YAVSSRAARGATEESSAASLQFVEDFLHRPLWVPDAPELELVRPAAAAGEDSFTPHARLADRALPLAQRSAVDPVATAGRMVGTNGCERRLRADPRRALVGSDRGQQPGRPAGTWADRFAVGQRAAPLEFADPAGPFVDQANVVELVPNLAAQHPPAAGDGALRARPG